MTGFGLGGSRTANTARSLAGLCRWGQRLVSNPPGLAESGLMLGGGARAGEAFQASLQELLTGLLQLS